MLRAVCPIGRSERIRTSGPSSNQWAYRERLIYRGFRAAEQAQFDGLDHRVLKKVPENHA